MRDIKFRAWHKKHNEVYDVISLKFDYDGILEQAVVTDKTFHDQRLVKTDDLILEQFTGLHDENGKEIYEGDVVEYVFNVREAEVSAIGEVCFFENQGVYGMKNVKYNNQELRRLCDIENERAGEVFCIAGYDNTDEDQTLIFAYDYFVDDDMEILGNIHENPELLAGGDDNHERG